VDKGYWNVARNKWRDTENNGGLVGLARDGHAIYGPYNDAGELWACDEHDICNGVFFDNGQYAYVATVTYPYLVGCYGPSTVQFFPIDDECSSNEKCFACQGLTIASSVLVALAALNF